MLFLSPKKDTNDCELWDTHCVLIQLIRMWPEKRGLWSHSD